MSNEQDTVDELRQIGADEIEKLRRQSEKKRKQVERERQQHGEKQGGDKGNIKNSIKSLAMARGATEWTPDALYEALKDSFRGRLIKKDEEDLRQEAYQDYEKESRGERDHEQKPVCPFHRQTPEFCDGSGYIIREKRGQDGSRVTWAQRCICHPGYSKWGIGIVRRQAKAKGEEQPRYYDWDDGGYH